MNVYFVGYKPRFLFQNKHTNYWPWSYLVNTLKGLGYNAYHANPSEIDHKIPNIYVCWLEPHSLELIEKYNLHKDSIILQKLTDMDNKVESRVLNKFSDELSKETNEDFLKSWPFFPYQRLEVLAKTGYRFFAFAAKTRVDGFQSKEQIVKKYKEKIFWIPWGSMTVPYDQIMKTRPIVSGFQYDVGFVGSIWGNTFFGNQASYRRYVHPLIEHSEQHYLAGAGTERGPISSVKHMDVLKASKICPILHSNLWQTLEGVQDRFWTIFSLGRFGVCDNEGLYEFFNKDEVVVEKDPDEYYAKSIYFLNNVDKQVPYIEKALRRIKIEYNQHEIWKQIMLVVTKE